jgi:hypothetical protein
LIDHIKSDFDVGVYWKTLKENGITKERLLSYDRAIHSEPNFRRDQKDGLLRDLGNYMRTLKVGFINLSGLKLYAPIFHIQIFLKYIKTAPGIYSIFTQNLLCCAWYAQCASICAYYSFQIKDCPKIHEL